MTAWTQTITDSLFRSRMRNKQMAEPLGAAMAALELFDSYRIYKIPGESAKYVCCIGEDASASDSSLPMAISFAILKKKSLDQAPNQD